MMDDELQAVTVLLTVAELDTLRRRLPDLDTPGDVLRGLIRALDDLYAPHGQSR
jgi:hypothetical protein